MNRLTSLALCAAALAAAAPAAAQYKPEQGRTGRVANDIARGVGEAVDAIGTVVDSVDRSVGEVRYRRAERFAIERCAPRVARYGRMRVAQVEPYGRRSIRVYGTAEADGWGARSAPRSFACTVRDDGRVKLRTRRA